MINFEINLSGQKILNAQYLYYLKEKSLSMKKILVVDDELSMRDLAVAILEKAGFEVEVASSGRECLKMLELEKPDLILMDVMMPGMDGKETTKKIRENPKTKRVKIAFLTVVLKAELDKKDLKKFKISDFIIKPFDNNDLIQRVKRLVG